MKTYQYETHLHTDETSPCGKVPAQEAVRMYHGAGYSGIIVTDHYFERFFALHPIASWEKKIDFFLSGYRKARAEGEKLGMDIILGMEICFKENSNDYLVYGFDEDFLYRHKKLYQYGLKKFRELTAEMGIYIIQAHPFRPYITPAPPSLIDGVEIYNGNPRHNSSNHLALQFAQENRLLMTSGSDFHQPQDGFRGGLILRKRITGSNVTDMFKKELLIDFIKTE